MKKKLLTTLLCLCMAFVLLPVTAFAVEVSNFYADGFLFTENDTTSQTVSLDEAPKEVTSVNLTEVTYESETYTVTSLAEDAFANCSNLTTVNLPMVTSLDMYAFANCYNLTTVNLPMVTSLAMCAFSDCTGLTTVVLPNVTSIEDYAFSDCTGLTTVVLPNVTSIEDNAFFGCTNLKSVTIWQENGAYDFSGTPDSCTLYVPSSADLYEEVLDWPGGNEKIVGLWSVSGTVYDKDGERCANIAVSVDGISVQTGEDGSYTVYVKPNQKSTITASIPDVGDKSITVSNVTGDLTGKDISFKPAASSAGSYTPSPVTVYNDPTAPNASMWLAGAGLSASDLLVTQRDPQGPAYEAMQKLANSDDVFQTYNISLQSGKKTSTSPMHLSFNLDEKYTGQSFTLVHQKADTTYEYFYDAADANGDLNFGPLYELSPFMLVRGTLLTSPKTADAAQPALWLGLMLLSSAALAVSVLQGRKKRQRA